MSSTCDSRRSANGRRVLVVVVLLFIALCITLIYTWWYAGADAVRQELEALRAAGAPVTPDELSEFYMGNDPRTDIADLWLQGIRPLETAEFNNVVKDLPVVGSGEEPIPAPGQAWSQLEDVEAVLVQYSDALAFMKQAAEAGPVAHFDLDFNAGFHLLLDHVQAMRSGARVLSLQAHCRAHRGDAAGTLDAIRTGFLLSRALDDEPLLVSQLVQIACGAISLGTLVDVMPYVDFSDQQLQKLQDTIRQVDYRRNMKRGLMGERALGIMAFRNPGSVLEDGERPKVWVNLLSRNADLLVYLEMMQRTVESFDRSWPDARQEVADINAEFQELVSSGLNSYGHIMTALLTPAIEATTDAGARAAAHRKIVDVALAVQRYQFKHGRAPDQLEGLIPEYLPQIPVDPYDGKTLRYLAQDTEVVIYSIGRDNQDDGGQSDNSMEPDIVVRLPVAESAD